MRFLRSRRFRFLLRLGRSFRRFSFRLFLRLGSGFRCSGFGLLLRVSSRLGRRLFCRFPGIRLRFRLGGRFGSGFLRFFCQCVRFGFAAAAALAAASSACFCCSFASFAAFLRLQPLLFELFQPFLFRRLFLT